MAAIEEGKVGEPVQIPGRLNGKPAMIGIERLGVSLLPVDVTPDIHELPNTYDHANRERTLFDERPSRRARKVIVLDHLYRDELPF